MKYIGIIYAKSRTAGDNIKAALEDKLRGENYEIFTDEQPSYRYAEAKNIDETASILFTSVMQLTDAVPDHEPIIIIAGANSVHIAWPNLQRLIAASPDKARVHLLSMIESTIQKANSAQYKKVLLLASSSSVTSQLYHRPLATANIDIIDLEPQQQTQVNHFITKGIVKLTQTEIADLIEIVSQYKNLADAVIFGCAELGAVFNSANLGLPVIDSTSSLISSVVAYVIK